MGERSDLTLDVLPRLIAEGVNAASVAQTIAVCRSLSSLVPPGPAVPLYQRFGKLGYEWRLCFRRDTSGWHLRWGHGDDKAEVVIDSSVQVGVTPGAAPDAVTVVPCRLRRPRWITKDRDTLRFDLGADGVLCVSDFDSKCPGKSRVEHTREGEVIRGHNPNDKTWDLGLFVPLISALARYRRDPSGESDWEDLEINPCEDGNSASVVLFHLREACTAALKKAAECSAVENGFGDSLRIDDFSGRTGLRLARDGCTISDADGDADTLTLALRHRLVRGEGVALEVSVELEDVLTEGALFEELIGVFEHGVENAVTEAVPSDVQRAVQKNKGQRNSGAVIIRTRRWRELDENLVLLDVALPTGVFRMGFVFFVRRDAEKRELALPFQVPGRTFRNCQLVFATDRTRKPAWTTPIAEALLRLMYAYSRAGGLLP